ncbi:efflux RND transporter permease subunit [Occallatibacter riparius]|uniref:CusA/CzcA family heavy metal efflux RND transporter n=1 Tax=Occallatibacter riparius TaxID=1002689 RepID=A0A9J7BP17_9BACT|nr:CusA/CzcA family heavy metal efflux RND transporter [Occallatibacter riparius]UWZ84483.1 CusA/CzcA family heavy metal efflux RND transporter [Occallatibacter riparius]
MKALIATILRYRVIALIAMGAWLAAGTWAVLRLDIEAYPDPSPPLVDVITQNPSWSAEEMEQQVTVPIETVLNGIPHLEYVRSTSLFGLSDVKLYFDFDSDYYADRQEVLNRLQTVTLPTGLQPQLSPWSAVGEIYRYQLKGPAYSLNELKATQDWFVVRELKQVPGTIDVSTFGGTTKQYHADIDPNRLLQFNVTLPQIITAITSSNQNVGGNYLQIGDQNVNVRGIGLLGGIKEMGAVLIAEHNGVPVYLRDVADIKEGFQPPLGRVGRNNESNIVKGTVLLQRGEQSLPALKGLREKVKALNSGILPPGMKIDTIYDRTTLIDTTTETVWHIILTGLGLVTLLLLVFLGDFPLAMVTALTIPFAILFAFGLMSATGHSANLISIGAIDFGIIVDSAIVVLENIYRRLHEATSDEHRIDLIAEASSEAAKPVLFSTLIILVAFIPLFTMKGVPGRIFAPMSLTYSYALTGALLFALLFAPVLASFRRKVRSGHTADPRQVRWLKRHYERILLRVVRNPKKVLAASVLLLIAALACFGVVGGEFMPPLEEGNLWIRTTVPQDISLDYAVKLADDMRHILGSFPEVKQVVSQVGRPDDGTDPTTFNNIEFEVDLKPPSEWKTVHSKDELIDEMNKALGKYPGVSFNFSQNIQDNVEEAMSGVKGENSLKLFGDDIEVLAGTAKKIMDVMGKVPGITDLAVFKETGQPNLIISIDRAAAGRYGLMASDINAAVQAAIGGTAATQILEGDRRFDFVVRYQPQYRENVDAMRNILLATADGSHVPLGEVASIGFREGAFMIYRENGRRYIPIKFSVRGRDLAGTIADVQGRLERSVKLPEGYHFEWAGEYDSLRKEQRRLAIIIPITVGVILGLLYVSFNSLRDALAVMSVLPFGIAGGVLSLLISGTPFSISAAVGFASVIGVATLGGLVFVAGIRRAEAHEHGMEHSIVRASVGEMRAVLMACLAAGLGLLPAAVSHGIGVQAQQPLARVVVGGMVTTTFAILIVVPVIATLGLVTTGAVEGEA